MKLSVIMSVYNCEKHLSKAIESILNQTCKDFEFIIVDDGSQDNTLKKIKSYAQKDNRIKILINITNMGLTKSLNRAIRHSIGEYIVRQDGDDISLPKRLEKQINFLKNNPDYSFCGCNGFRKQIRHQDLCNYFEFDEIRSNLIVENCFNHSSIVIRRDVLNKYGYYDEKYLYGQDYELWCRLIYRYRLKAKNLKEKLIIAEISPNRFLKLNMKKFLTQRLNNIKTKVKYLKFVPYKFKGIISIFIKCIEILTLSYLMERFSKFFKKIKI